MADTSAVALETTERQSVSRRDTLDPALVLTGTSPAVEALRQDIGRVAASSAPVLVTGETGAGKSLVARAIHLAGPRARETCVVVACHAFPETLLEIELFGCVKGSAVGATADRAGVLEVACGGTVVLANIESIGLDLQERLVRFLASHRVQSRGMVSDGAMVDTRIIATTAIPFERLGESHLHPDLSRRLTQQALRVPSLHERKEDVQALVECFWAVSNPLGPPVRYSPEAVHALMAYSWPGNISQLHSVVTRLAADKCGGEIQAADLPVGIRPRRRGAVAAAVSRSSSTGEILFARLQASGESFWSAVYPLFMKREITRTDLRDLVSRACAATSGNVDDLLRVLNMSRRDRRRFVRFLEKYGCAIQAEP